MSSTRITPAELAAALASPMPPVVLDASWHMPSAGRSAQAEYLQAHIPRARFFDIEAIRDTQSPYPHMLPSEEACARHFGALGLQPTDEVVVYDSHGLFSAPRAWWMLRAMGHEGAVRVLEGGLPAWRASHLPLASGTESVVATRYGARLNPELVADWAETLAALSSPHSRVLDARSPARFSGTEKEPRAGLRSGHMPGAVNLHYARLIDPQGRLLPEAALRDVFAQAAITPEQGVITSCGSGITACILALGLHEIGHGAVRVYDGSWAEWGAREGLPIEAA